MAQHDRVFDLATEVVERIAGLPDRQIAIVAFGGALQWTWEHLRVQSKFARWLLIGVYDRRATVAAIIAELNAHDAELRRVQALVATSNRLQGA